MRYFAGWLFLAAMTSSALAVDNTVIVTPGTGVTMRSKDIGSGTQSMVTIPGDTAGTPLATAPGTPNASFALPIQGVTSGTALPISAGSLPLPTGAATKANQDTNSATTAHTCSTGGTSEIGCLGQIDDDVKGAIAAGTNIIGKVGIDQTTPGTTNGVQITAGTANVGQVGGSVNIAPTSCSLAVTTGGTAQNIIAASATVHGFTIANIDTSAGSGEPIWINFVGTAAASTNDSFPLAAPTATTFASLSSYTTPLGFGTSHAVSVIAATTGHKISCVRW